MLKINITPEVREQVTLLLGDSEIAAWWIAEYEKRAEDELAEAIAEQEWVSKLNFNSQLRPIEGLGQMTVAMGPKMHAWLTAYCPNWQYDETFLKQLIKDNQHLCFRPGYLKKPQVTMPALNLKPTP
jgi:hypothetical protein